MSTLYQPTPVTSTEQADALPEGTVVTGTAAGVVEKGSRGRWWAGLHQVDARAIVGGTALVPTEAEEKLSDKVVSAVANELRHRILPDTLEGVVREVLSARRLVTPWTPKE